MVSRYVQLGWEIKKEGVFRFWSFLKVLFGSVGSFAIFQLNIMEEQEVLELIEEIVRPLRTRVEHLEKQNQVLRTQMASFLNGHQDQQRLRSSSREGDRGSRRQDAKEVRSPSLEKRDRKPVWNYRKPVKAENGAYKSPPPVEKKNYKQVQPKIVTRYDSKEKMVKAAVRTPEKPKKEDVQYLSFEKNLADKKIMGGQKFSENGSQDDKKQSEPASVIGASLKGQSVNENNDINPESNSQEVSQQGGSELIPEEAPKRTDLL